MKMMFTQANVWVLSDNTQWMLVEKRKHRVKF